MSDARPLGTRVAELEARVKELEARHGTFVVMVDRSEVQATQIDEREEFYVTLIHDPFRKGGIERIGLWTSEIEEEAFVFERHAAAEVIAALVGGRVVAR